MLDLVSVNGFENPELLWLVPVAWLAVFLLSFRSRIELHPPVLIAISITRSLLLTLLLFTLAGPYRKRDELDPVRWIVVRDRTGKRTRIASVGPRLPGVAENGSAMNCRCVNSGRFRYP